MEWEGLPQVKTASMVKSTRFQVTLGGREGGRREEENGQKQVPILDQYIYVCVQPFEFSFHQVAVEGGKRGESSDLLPFQHIVATSGLKL